MSEIISKELDYNSEEDFLEDNEGILDYIYMSCIFVKLY